MNLWASFHIAIRALRKNKMRCGLTVLGIVIGIAAVTTMVSIGQSFGQAIRGAVQNLGTNVIVVEPDRQRRGGVRQGNRPTLTAEDATAMVEECPAVVAATPLVFTSGQVIFGNANWRPEIWGVGPDYPTVRNWPVRLGGFFTDRDVKSASKVCVIGQTLVAKLFQTTNPIDRKIRIKNIPFRVIGVLEAKGADLGGNDQDNFVVIPYSTVRKRLQGSSFGSVDLIMASATSFSQMANAKVEIEQLLFERHGIALGENADFQVRDSQEFAAMLTVITGTVTLLLASIAGISLLVGGIGIMNIMLVSVTERTREIGIRLAVGARSRDILRQFLVESVLLSVIGGMIGVALGIVASLGVTKLINTLSSGSEWPSKVSLPAAAVAVLFAAAVGIFFGYYPARRASRLDPIDALRYE